MEDMAAFSETDEEDFAGLFGELVYFYQDTARNGNSMFITIC